MKRTVFKEFSNDMIDKPYVAIPEFITAVEETFNKSTIDIVQNFIKHNNYNKWMVFSDYVFDKNKNNNVVTFSFVPYIFDFNNLQDFIKSLANKDLKNTKNIKQEYLEFLNNMPILSFSFILKGKRKIHYSEEKKFYINKIKKIIEMLEFWIKTTPENKEQYKKDIKDFRAFLNELNKNTNFSIKRDIAIISLLAAYLMYEFSKIHSNIEIIGWFSDRDKLTEYGGKKFNFSLIYNLSHIYFHIFTEEISIKPKLIHGKTNDKKLFYDEYIKIPDYICGVLADYNFLNNKCSHDKHIKLMEELIASNEKIIIFKLLFKKEIIECAIEKIVKDNKS